MLSIKNVDNELEDVTKQLEAAQKKQKELLAKRMGHQGAPKTWSSSSSETLVALQPTDTQYWDVAEQLRATMPDAWPTKVITLYNARRSFHHLYCCCCLRLID